MSQYAKSRQDERRKNFKKGLDAADARKKREEQAVRIRKEQRIESFQKRRHMGDANEIVSFGTNAAERVPLLVPPIRYAPKLLSLCFSPRQLQEMNMLVAMVKSNDPAKMIEATGRIRKLLSIGTCLLFRK